MRGYSRLTRAVSVVSVFALGAGVIAAQPASADAPGVLVDKIKAQPGYSSIGADGAMYLDVALANDGGTATSAPISLTFPNLPQGVTIVTAPGNPDTSCTSDGCSYAGSIPATSIAKFALLAKVAGSVAPGTQLTFAVAADSPEDTRGAVESVVSFSVAAPADDHPVLSSDLTADRPVVRGRKAVLSQVVTNKAGKTAKRITLANVVPNGAMVSVKGSGSGWKCDTKASYTCVYGQPLDVGQSAPPLKLKIKTSKKVKVKALSAGSAKTGKVGELRWKVSATTPGAPAQKLDSSLLFTLRAPALPKAARPSPDVPDWTKLAHVEAQLQTTGDLRPGGVRPLLLETMYNKVSRTSGPIRTTINLPAGTSIQKFVTKQWKCTTSAGGRQGNCVLRKSLSGDALVPRITVRVKANKSVSRKQTVRATAAVRWTATDGPHTDTDSVTLKVDSPLKVKAAKKKRKVLGSPQGPGPTTSRIVQLHAAITGTHPTERPSYKWRQVSGPKVAFIGATGHTHAGTDASASFRSPQVKKKTTLRFKVTASVDGATSTDSVTATVLPRKVAVMPARVDATRKAIKPGLGINPIPDRSNWVGHHTGKSAIKIGGDAKFNVKPGKKITLKPSVTGPAKDYKWVVISGPKSIIKGSRKGKSVTVKAPKNPGLLMVKLTVKGKKGKKRVMATKSQVIRVLKPTQVRDLAVTSALMTNETNELSARDSSSEFCKHYTGDAATGTISTPFKVQNGAGTLIPGAVALKGSSCTDAAAAITFTDASITFGSHGFTNVNGQLDSTGLTFTTGTYKTPDSWKSALDYLGDPTFSFNTGSVPISAPWAGTDFGLLSGSYTINSFLFLKPPGGWSGTTTFTFTPTAPAPMAIDASMSKADKSKSAGDVELTGTMGTDGTFAINVSAANLVTFTTSTGSQSTVSGTGTISLTDPKGTIAYAISLTLPGPIALLTDFNLANIVVKWDHTGVAITADGSIVAQSGNVGLKLDGSFADDNDWSFDVTQASPWVSSDVTISNLVGKIANASGTTSFTVQGDASNITVPDGLTVTKMTAVVTNTCPPKAKDCTTGAVRLAIDVTGTVSVGGSAEPFSGSLDVDLGTMEVSFSAKVKAANFGPVGLNLSNITIGFDSKGAPLPSGTCSTSTPGNDLVTFAATIDSIFGASNVPVNGVIGSNGYCISATLPSFAPTGNAEIDGAFDGVAFIYTSYDTTLTVPGLSKSVAVPADTAAVYGTFNTPASFGASLGGLSGAGSFHAILTEEKSGGLGFNGGIDYSFTNPLYLSGSSDSSQSSLAMTNVSLAINVGAGLFDLTLKSDGDYYTPAATDGSSEASTVPLSVAVELGFAPPTFTFSATAAGNGAVTDAFGEQGLILSNLTISGSLGASFSLGFAAEAVLPQAWVSSVGVQPNTPIGLVIDISDTPCLQFTIGTPTQSTTAIDFMNRGTLVADYGNVLLAPLGCSFGDETISPGFALDFHGQIAGDEIDFDASLTLGGSGFALNADVSIQEFSLAGVELDNTTFTLDLDPSASTFDITFVTTVDVGGSTLNVNGSYQHNGTTTTASFSMASSGDVTIAGVTFNNANVNFQYTSAPSGTNMSFSLACYVAFLGQSFNGTVAFTMTNGAVTAASGAFSISLNFYVASVSGNLTFTYQQGQGASGTFTDGSVSALGIDFTNVSGSLQSNGAYAVTGYMAIGTQQGSTADTWLNLNEDGEWNTTFWGTLAIQLTGGNGQSASMDYANSTVEVHTEWSTHTYTSYGSWVPVPNPGCPASFVGGNGLAGTPELNFWLTPRYIENASSDGDGDDDTNSCVSFTSQVYP